MFVQSSARVSTHSSQLRSQRTSGKNSQAPDSFVPSGPNDPPPPPVPFGKRCKASLGGAAQGFTSGAFIGGMCGLVVGTGLGMLGLAGAVLAYQTGRPGLADRIGGYSVMTLLGSAAVGSTWSCVSETVSGAREGWQTGRTPDLWNRPF